VTNIYTESQLWGAERVNPIDFKSVPKLDLTGIESDSSVSSAEQHFVSRFESEFSLPILSSVIPMDFTETDAIRQLPSKDLASPENEGTVIWQLQPLGSSSTDDSESLSSGDDSELSDGSSRKVLKSPPCTSKSPEAHNLPSTLDTLTPGCNIGSLISDLSNHPYAGQPRQKFHLNQRHHQTHADRVKNKTTSRCYTKIFLSQSY